MRNILGPYQLRIKYSYAGRSHTMSFEVGSAIGAEPPSYRVLYGNAIAHATEAQTAAEEFQTALRGCFSTSVAFNGWELWHSVDGGAPVFTYSGTFANPTGSNVQATVPYGMAVFSFRTGLFGKFRLQLMESVLLLNEVHGYGDFAAGDPRKVLVDYILSADGICKGRDGAQPTNFIRVSTKTSDALRRRHIMGF